MERTHSLLLTIVIILSNGVRAMEYGAEAPGSLARMCARVINKAELSTEELPDRAQEIVDAQRRFDELGQMPYSFSASSFLSKTLDSSQKCTGIFVRFLLHAGADVNNRDRHGFEYTPLHRAARRCHTEALRVLLAAGADFNAQRYHETPLHLAAVNGHTEIVHLLCSVGANVNVRSYQKTPLHLAAGNDKPGVVHILLAAGADVNARDRLGDTPLHIAVRNGHTKIVRTLCAAGADLNARDEWGNGLLYSVYLSEKPSIIFTLLAAKVSRLWKARKNRS